jgi:hypothetical protein
MHPVQAGRIQLMTSIMATLLTIRSSFPYFNLKFLSLTTHSQEFTNLMQLNTKIRKEADARSKEFSKRIDANQTEVLETLKAARHKMSVFASLQVGGHSHFAAYPKRQHSSKGSSLFSGKLWLQSTIKMLAQSRMKICCRSIIQLQGTKITSWRSQSS